jgi:hypothetical protein
MYYNGNYADFFFSREVLNTIPFMYYPKYIQDIILSGNDYRILTYNRNNIII